MKFNPKALYYFALSLLSAAGGAIQTYMASPEALTQIGDILGNAGLAAIIMPVLMFIVTLLIRLIPSDRLTTPK